MYHNGFELSYLSMYGYVRTMTYTYYNYETSSGEKIEITVLLDAGLCYDTIKAALAGE